MSSKLQLHVDVCYLYPWWPHLVNAYGVEAWYGIVEFNVPLDTL